MVWFPACRFLVALSMTTLVETCEVFSLTLLLFVILNDVKNL